MRVKTYGVVLMEIPVKKYFEITLDLCNTCYTKIKPVNTQRKRRENIRPYNPLNT